MEEYWGASKEQVIENIGEPHESRQDEKNGLDEVIYKYSAEADFQPSKQVTYGFYDNRLVIISTGYDFEEGLYKQYELYHESLVKNFNEKLEADPLESTKDDDGNLVTIWNKNNSEIVVFFSNDPSEPNLVVIQTYKPQNSGS